MPVVTRQLTCGGGLWSRGSTRSSQVREEHPDPTPSDVNDDELLHVVWPVSVALPCGSFERLWTEEGCPRCALNLS